MNNLVIIRNFNVFTFLTHINSNSDFNCVDYVIKQLNLIKFQIKKSARVAKTIRKKRRKFKSFNRAEIVYDLILFLLLQMLGQMLTIVESLIKGFVQTSTVDHKLDFLDGYRGFLAIAVVAEHFAVGLNKDKALDYKIFEGLGINIGVLGFFMLSAFLLTYRLLIDFDKQSTSRFHLLKLCQYFIRRFFRIYLTFQIFWLIFHQLTPKTIGSIALGKGIRVPYMYGVTLYSTGYSHLWTIPIEIRYYFVIPVLSYLSTRCGKYWYVLTILLLLQILAIEFLNPFGRTNDALDFPYQHLLHPSMPIFLKGSLVALVYYNVKKQHTNLAELIASSMIQKVISLATFVAHIYQFRYCSHLWNRAIDIRQNPMHAYIASYYLFVVLLSMVFGAPNYFTNIYNNSVLRSFGKYSFGIYLLQYIVLKPLSVYRFYFETYIGPLILSLVMCYMSGLIWFYLVENVLMNTANSLCVKLSTVKFFQQKPILLLVQNAPK